MVCLQSSYWGPWSILLCFPCDRVPSYKDVVGEDASEGREVGSEDGEEEGGEGQLVSSDEEVERQEEFERQYNFRFEEPGGTAVSGLRT